MLSFHSRTVPVFVAILALAALSTTNVAVSRYAAQPAPQDQLGNFEIQRLMSDFNTAQTLASTVRKKSDDTTSELMKAKFG